MTIASETWDCKFFIDANGTFVSFTIQFLNSHHSFIKNAEKENNR